jgi:hypothetical protein
MKKLILMLVISLWSLAAYAIPTFDLDGLKQFNLNNVSSTRYKFYGDSSGTATPGICRIIIRTGWTGDFNQLAQKFKFIYGWGSGNEREVTPIITQYALMFQLMKKTDFAYDYIIIESKDGRSIGQHINELFGATTVAVIAGTCYSQ